MASETSNMAGWFAAWAETPSGSVEVSANTAAMTRLLGCKMALKLSAGWSA
jgi:hypothetical protein